MVMGDIGRSPRMCNHVRMPTCPSPSPCPFFFGFSTSSILLPSSCLCSPPRTQSRYPLSLFRLSPWQTAVGLLTSWAMPSPFRHKRSLPTHSSQYVPSGLLLASPANVASRTPYDSHISQPYHTPHNPQPCHAQRSSQPTSRNPQAPSAPGPSRSAQKPQAPNKPLAPTLSHLLPTWHFNDCLHLNVLQPRFSILR